MSEPTNQTRRIRDLNDHLRRTMSNGDWMLTPGVLCLPRETAVAAIRAVQAFEAFTPDNDPYGEYDFGSVTVEGETLFWKIEAYDKALQYQSLNPAGASVTHRVLTLMLAREY